MDDNNIKEAVENNVVKNVLFNFGRTEDGDFVLSVNLILSLDFAFRLANGIFNVAKMIKESSNRIVVAQPNLKIFPGR